MNMRHGSVEHRKELAEQVQMQTIRSAADVGIDRKRRKFAASRKLKHRMLEAALKREGIPDILADNLLPPVLRKRLISLKYKPIPPGFTVCELFQMTRATPKLLSLLNEGKPSGKF